MVSVVPYEVLRCAQGEVPCRQKQLQQLAVYYNQHFPSPSILVAHGLEHTGKLETITALLRASEIIHTVIRSKDCLSQRHLLAKIFAGCVRQLDEIENVDKYDRIDNLNSLVVNLQRLFENRSEKFVLIIDAIDKQRGVSSTLLPALAKLGDLVPAISLILTSSSPRSIPLQRSGIPYVHFPPYNRAESITMILKERIPMPQDRSDDFETVHDAQLASIYKSFVTTVYDTLATHTSTSFQSFRITCDKLWPRFIWPMLSGESLQKKKGNTQSSTLQWDFARLLSRNRALFQREGENALLSRLTTDTADIWTFTQLSTKQKDADNAPQPATLPSEVKQEPPLLKSFSTLLLVSSYLASHTPPKHDIILFSRLSSSSTHKRKYLSSALSKSRTAGVRKTPTKKKAAALDSRGGDETPSGKDKADKSHTSEGLAGEKTPKSTRLLLEKTSNIPRPFTLERVIAILRTIHPDGLPRSKGAADKVYAEMAELERLRLVVRCSGGYGDGGARGGDDGILEEKWRVNVGRDFVNTAGRFWGVGLDGWEID